MRRIALQALFITATLLAAHSTACASIIYVDDDAPPPGDGTSWTTAYRYLQDALTDAEADEAPTTIHVAQGLYRPNERAGPSPWHDDATFYLTDATTLRGGYAGFGAPDPNAWNPHAHETILTGDLLGDDLPLPYPPAYLDYPGLYDLRREDNSTAVVAPVWGRTDIVLEGVVITAAGPAHPGMHVPVSGAGLRVWHDARATVRYCTFRANVAPGIYCDWSTLVAEDCIFEQNVSTMSAGGLLVEYADAHLTRCIFRENVARDGGGVYHSGDGHLRLEACTFYENATPWGPTGYGPRAYVSGSVGGAIYASGPGELLGCEFRGNSAGAGGGARLESDWTIRDCTFRNNRSYEVAGALNAQDATLEITSCAFLANTSLGDGGVVYNSGSSIDFTACTFAGNTSVYRGAVICTEYSGPSTARQGRRGWVVFESHLVLNHCTSVGNVAPEGQTIYCAGAFDPKQAHISTLALSNCILDNGPNDIFAPAHSQVTIAYTNLRGGPSAIYDPCESITWGPGNIDVDPLFANPGYWDPNGTPDDPNDDVFIEGDYHLKSQAGRWHPATETWLADDVTSPCIDAGDPNNPIADEPLPHGGIINMGTYGGTHQASKSYLAPPTKSL